MLEKISYNLFGIISSFILDNNYPLMKMCQHNKRLQKKLQLTLYNYQKAFLSKNIGSNLQKFNKNRLQTFINYNYDIDMDINTLNNICEDLKVEYMPKTFKETIYEKTIEIKDKNTKINDNNYKSIILISKNINYNISIINNLANLTLKNFNYIKIPISLLINLSELILENNELLLLENNTNENEINLKNLKTLKIDRIYDYKINGLCDEIYKNNDIKLNIDNIEKLIISYSSKGYPYEEELYESDFYILKNFKINFLYDLFNKKLNDKFKQLDEIDIDELYNGTKNFKNIKYLKFDLSFPNKAYDQLIFSITKLNNEKFEYNYKRIRYNRLNYKEKDIYNKIYIKNRYSNFLMLKNNINEIENSIFSIPIDNLEKFKYKIILEFFDSGRNKTKNLENIKEEDEEEIEDYENDNQLNNNNELYYIDGKCFNFNVNLNQEFLIDKDNYSLQVIDIYQPNNYNIKYIYTFFQKNLNNLMKNISHFKVLRKLKIDITIKDKEEFIKYMKNLSELILFEKLYLKFNNLTTNEINYISNYFKNIKIENNKSYITLIWSRN